MNAELRVECECVSVFLSSVCCLLSAALLDCWLYATLVRCAHSHSSTATPHSRTTQTAARARFQR